MMQHMSLDADRISRWLNEYAAKPLAVSAFFVLLALLWTFPLQHVIAYPFVFLFFGAIMGSAWFGGYIAGSMAVVMSSLLIAFFFMPPLYSMSIGREFRSYEGAFIVCAIAITMVSSARKKSDVAIRTSRDELELRVRERTAELQCSNAELAERERQLRLLTEAIPQQIWRTDAQGEIEYCNRNLVDFVGRDTNELRGESFFGILHPEDAALFKERWTEARATCARFEMQARVKSQAGPYRWFLIRGNPQLNTEGRVQCWYGVHIDIEEQQRAQYSLAVAQDNLLGLSRTLTMAEMAASIAHELNQPLTALMTDAHACRRWLLAQPANLDRAMATAERIVRECTRASAVVSRVRSLFNRNETQRETTDLNSLIRDLVKILRDESLRHEVLVRLRLSDCLPHIAVDPVQIQQVLLNLTINGMEAMSGQIGLRELEISTELCNGREVVVTVMDHGTGLSEQAKAKMFEPFFTTKREGTGMGLAICRSIIEAHDGRIWADSLPAGTAVHFALRAGA